MLWGNILVAMLSSGLQPCWEPGSMYWTEESLPDAQSIEREAVQDNCFFLSLRTCLHIYVPFHSSNVHCSSTLLSVVVLSRAEHPAQHQNEQMTIMGSNMDSVPNRVSVFFLGITSWTWKFFGDQSLPKLTQSPKLGMMLFCYKMFGFYSFPIQFLIKKT